MVDRAHLESLSPATSFYALSDDEEGEYNTVRHARSIKDVKLVYTKSKVYVHPTSVSKDNIAGFIALIEQNSAPGSVATRSGSSQSRSAGSKEADKLLLGWVPENSLGESYDTYVKVDISDTSSPPKTTCFVPAPPFTTNAANAPIACAFSIPICDIYSLLIRPPSFGWWYGSVVINTKAGDSFPPLFFHDDECKSTIAQRKKLARESFDPFQNGSGMFWGGDEVLRWLKRYVKIERAGADPSVYLVNPTEDDRKGFAKMRHENQDSQAASPKTTDDAQMDPLVKIFKQTKWNILEKLSQVTTFTRRTTQAIVESKSLPPQIRHMLGNPTVQAVTSEYDSARIYLARWAMQIAEQSDKEHGQRIWRAEDVLQLEDTGVGEFEILDLGTARLGSQPRRAPVGLDEWNGFFDRQSGRLNITSDEVKQEIFHGGLDPSDGVRKNAWLFLLGVFDWNSTKDERQASMNSMRDEYVRIKAKWWERMVESSSNPDETESWREQRSRIEKDVHRTDRTVALFAGEDVPHPNPDSPFADVGTNVHLEQMKDMLLTYNEYNPELGYVQGMSDLLAPIYAVLQDDAMAFWAFVKFMQRMERNFLRDQSGMRLQLLTLDHLVQVLDPQLYLHLQKAESTNFFCFFRMLLIWFKREFGWLDILRLWEVIWTDWLSSNFHIFIALAILEKHRSVIMEHLRHFDEVLKYINELSNTIDPEETLTKAEALFYHFQRTVQALDHKSSFPAPNPLQSRDNSRNSQVSPASLGTNKMPLKQDTKLKKTVGSDDFSNSASPSVPEISGDHVQSAGRKNRVASVQHGSGQSLEPLKTISPELRTLLSRDAPG